VWSGILAADWGRRAMFYVFGLLWIVLLAALLVGGYEYIVRLRDHS
jgi:hypothetical protein